MDLVSAFQQHLTPGSSIEQVSSDCWRLTIPDGPPGKYRLAQLDDYRTLARGKFLWRPPVRLSLSARVSGSKLPGTWGFGFWNDPFSISLGVGGTTRRLPALPNCAWFFYASSENFLSLRDSLPARGLLAASFSASRIPAFLLAPGLVALPGLAWQPTARLIRRAARLLIHEDSSQLLLDVTGWHQYEIEWQPRRLVFSVDGKEFQTSTVVPHAPLGCVMWLDNQYAAFTPAGKLRYGTLANPEPAWLEIKDLSLEYSL